MSYYPSYTYPYFGYSSGVGIAVGNPIGFPATGSVPGVTAGVNTYPYSYVAPTPSHVILFWSAPAGSTWNLTGIDFTTVTKVSFQRGPNYPYTNSFPNSSGSSHYTVSTPGTMTPSLMTIPYPALAPLSWNPAGSSLIRIRMYN